MNTSDLVVAAALVSVFIVAVGYLYLVRSNDVFGVADTFMKLGFPVLVLAISLGIVFVIAHFAIKYW